MKIKPLHDFVLIELPKQEERVGAIYIPQGAHQDKLIKAVVVAVGPGRWCDKTGAREDIGLVPGDVVLIDSAIWSVAHFPAWRLSAYENVEEGKLYHLIPCHAIKCIDAEATAATHAQAAE